MLMLLPVFVALLQTSGIWWERHLHRLCAIGVAVRAIVTYSRGGFLSAAALGGYYLVLSPKRVRSAIGIAVICLIVVPMMPDQFWDRMNTINASDDQRDESSLARLHTWRVGRIMGADNPIFGAGFHSFEYAFDRYDFLDGEYGTARAAHSTWFGVFGELGFVGLGLFVVMLLQTLYVSQRLRRTRMDLPRSPEIRIYATALQAAMVSMIVGGTFLHLHYSEMLWHYFALTIALEGIADRTAAEALTTPIQRTAALASRPYSAAVLPPPARPAARVAGALLSQADRR